MNVPNSGRVEETDFSRLEVAETRAGGRGSELKLDESARADAARCLRCAAPPCRMEGCALGNRIPEIHDLVSHGQWEAASQVLHATDNFPEVTGRLCNHGCQTSCAQASVAQAIPIQQVECHVVERAFAEGWVQPVDAAHPSGKKVAIVGSGPAGLALAQQLARAGHEVVVYEAEAFPGGALRQAQPGRGLDEYLVDRRLRQLAAEGVKFVTGLVVGKDLSVGYLRRQCDLLCLTVQCLGLTGTDDAAPSDTHSSPGSRPPCDPDLVGQLHLQLDQRGLVVTSGYATSQSDVFAVDDLAADLSLVASAIRNGREAAAVVDTRLREGAPSTQK